MMSMGNDEECKKIEHIKDLTLDLSENIEKLKLALQEKDGKIARLEAKISQLEASRNEYKRLYEKERSSIGDRVALRESDKTKILKISDYLSEILGRWEK